jgi:hypothetical protein
VSGTTKFTGRASYSGSNNRIKIKTLGFTNQFNSNNTSEYRPNASLITTTITEPFFNVTRSVDVQPPSSNLNFGNIELGKDSTRSITITNTGDVPVNLSDYKIIPDNAETFDDEFRIITRPANVSVNGSVNVNIRFSPRSQGAKNATL